MKRLLFIILAISLAAFMSFSCTKEKENAMYTIVCNFDTAINTTIMVFECDDQGSKLANNVIDDAEEGQEYSFTAIPEATRVKVYYKQETFWGTTDKWVQQVFVLRDQENTEILLDDNMIVGNKEP